MNDELVVSEIRKYFSTFRRGEVYKAAMDYMERLLIEEALEKTSGNQLEAARILGVNRNTLRSKVKSLKIDVGKFKRFS